MEKVFKNREQEENTERTLENLKKYIETKEGKELEKTSSSLNDKEKSERKKYLQLYTEYRKKYNAYISEREAEEFLNNERDIAEYNRWSLKLGQKWLNSFYFDKFWLNMGISLLKYKYVLNQEIINLQVCKDYMEGYYLPKDHKIVLCANNLTNYEKNYRFVHAVKRHLILMYDHVRSSDYDFNNCQHLSCSEIRAAKLSGYCKHSYSYFNGFYAPEKNETILKHCVKTKAVEHINTYYDHCSMDSRNTVDFVFEKCYHDNSPIYDFSKEKNFINKF